MTDAEEPIDDDDALAAEYVLGLLEEMERMAFERRLLSEPQLVRSVFAWERHFAAMVDAVPEVAPPRRLRSKILGRIDPPSRTSHLWMRLVTGLLAAASVAAVVLFVALDRKVGFAPDYAAELVSETGDLQINASFDSETGTLVLTRVGGGPAQDRALELWLIAAGAAAPISLGVLPDETEFRVQIEEETGNSIPGATLAVSDEPIGGSPTGQPTGAVLALGEVLPN